MTVNIELKNKVAIVTGAAGGIGEEIVKLLAMAECDIVLVDLENRIEKMQEIGRYIEEKYKVNYMIKSLDIRNVNEIDLCLEEIKEKYKSIDILVNNIGINYLVPSLKVKEEEWDNILDTNLKGMFFMSRAVARLMFQVENGSIINIASQHGVVGNENRAAYCSSKGGVVNLTKALAVEWAKYNIRINCVSPTFVLTKRNEEILNSKAFKRENLSQIPLGRYCKPEDVANATLFLASSLSEMITGSNIVVDGGWTAK